MTEPMSTLIRRDGVSISSRGAETRDPARIEAVARIVAPLTLAFLALLGWDLVVRLNHIPPYILPGPLLVAKALWTDWGTLYPSLLVTLKITFMALGVAVFGGVGLAVLFSLSPVDRAGTLPLRRDPSGDAHHRDSAADPDLCRQHLCGAPDLRLDRGLLPDPFQHHARAQQRGPQSARSLRALSERHAGRSFAISACRPRCLTFWAASGSPAACR